MFKIRKSTKSNKKFVDLYNQSIKANEDILDYTKLFEKNRSQVEANMKKLKAGATSDVKYFEEKLEENNKALKSTVDDGFDSSDPQKVKN